jgi:hypothetical protein
MPMGFRGVLQSFPAEFVSGKMVRFAVRCRGARMGVGSQIVKFGDSIVRALGHCVLLGRSMQRSACASFRKSRSGDETAFRQPKC